MKKKDLFTWMVLVLACISLVFMTSCAQQQTVPPEGVTEAAETGEAGEQAPQAGTATTATAPGEAESAEAEKQRRMQLQIDAFESASIYFDFDRSELKPEAQATLKNKAMWL